MLVDSVAGSAEVRFQVLTFRNRRPIRIPETNNVDAARLGSANGYFLKNSLSPKMLGKLRAGDARPPPSIGPKTEPIDQT